VTTSAGVNSATLHHPVSAAAVAHAFVSDIAANREFLARLPLDGLNVATLPEFLKRL
jgi:hypothetical protein